ncbi:MAG: KH domain-containing protein [Desulfobacteraceae bacterium]|nr:KH domain-containing protein [Desulfobacteraceae bacterium]
MRELIRFLAEALVDRPEQVTVGETESEGVLVEELRVAREDLGKVIGRQGRTAKAIRTLLSVAAARQGKKAKLEIAE